MPVNQNYRSGIVAIIGRPNVGKSTLLNTIIGEKVTIVSAVPQTTRHQIRGIYSEERGQIVFIDTPGLHRGKDKLDKFMNTASYDTVEGADCIIHLVDSSKPVGEEEHMVVDCLRDAKVPIILGLNKIDLKGKCIPEYISLWEQAKGKPIQKLKFPILFPLSARTSGNVDKLLDILFEHLPAGEPLYPVGHISDTPQKIWMADIIREKLFFLMREELPHSLTVVIQQWERKRRNVFYLRAEILVERESQKEIVIGKKGHILKQAGSLARRDLEDSLGGKVFLDLHVRTEAHWRDDELFLKETGYG